MLWLKYKDIYLEIKIAVFFWNYNTFFVWSVKSVNLCYFKPLLFDRNQNKSAENKRTFPTIDQCESKDKFSFTCKKTEKSLKQTINESLSVFCSFHTKLKRSNKYTFQNTIQSVQTC